MKILDVGIVMVILKSPWNPIFPLLIKLNESKKIMKGSLNPCISKIKCIILVIPFMILTWRIRELPHLLYTAGDMDQMHCASEPIYDTDIEAMRRKPKLRVSAIGILQMLPQI
jgi:hypothetical protein